jgi:NAD+ diphosphatase
MGSGTVDRNATETGRESQDWSLFHRYEPAYCKPMEGEEAGLFHPDRKAVWFLFQDDRLLVKTEMVPGVAAEMEHVSGEAAEMEHASGAAAGTEDDETGGIGAFLVGHVGLPAGGGAADWANGIIAIHSLGIFDGFPCHAALVGPDADTGIRSDGFSWQNLRTLLPQMDSDVGFLAGRALQTLNWQRNNRFCGRCGDKMAPREDERSMHCPSCDYRQYPRLSPAIIVAVTRGEELLLAHARHFPEGMFSLVAGFVEPGETFEDCVVREVREEVGIGIRDIRYLSSQPWPFPDSLMVGFTAKWATEEVVADGVEIGEAKWCARDRMPEIPGPHTIAGRIIRRWLNDRL